MGTRVYRSCILQFEAKFLWSFRKIIKIIIKLIIINNNKNNRKNCSFFKVLQRIPEWTKRLVPEEINYYVRRSNSNKIIEMLVQIQRFVSRQNFIVDNVRPVRPETQQNLISIVKNGGGIWKKEMQGGESFGRWKVYLDKTKEERRPFMSYSATFRFFFVYFFITSIIYRLNSWLMFFAPG